MKLKVLNLFAGIGGNRRLWENVEVTAVENYAPVAEVYRQNFSKDTLIVGDAHRYLEQNFKEFDFIWSSPPCQTHSRMNKATAHKSRRLPDMSLYSHILFLQHYYHGVWVVENVKPFYAPLIPPTQNLGRHLFWASGSIPAAGFKSPVDFMKSDAPAQIEKVKKAFGISYDKNIYFPGRHSPGQVLRNCVIPDMGLHVFNSLTGR